MTRDEAIKAVNTRLFIDVGNDCIAQIIPPDRFIDTLAALGVLKLDDPAPPPAPRCEPPPEHREKRWHWIKIPYTDCENCVVAWVEGEWKSLAGKRTPTNAAEHGWRYLAPCEEPKASGEDLDKVTAAAAGVPLTAVRGEGWPR